MNIKGNKSKISPKKIDNTESIMDALKTSERGFFFLYKFSKYCRKNSKENDNTTISKFIKNGVFKSMNTKAITKLGFLITSFS